MTLYRALRPLDSNIKRGEVTTLAWLGEEDIKRLEHRGAVSPIAAPPLSEMPLPKAALKKMKAAGLEDAADLLTKGDAELAKSLKVNMNRAAKWKQEVARLLMVELPERD